MNINELFIGENDTVLITHNIENIPKGEVDLYCSKLVLELSSVFGKGKVALLPIIGGDTWTFTVVRKARN
jgi:hypothetical protein